MEKLPELTHYLAVYGYYAVFLFVFLQQIGVPNPITNEFVLIFCGYLSYTATLNFYKIIGVAVVADFVGTMLLFFVFYFFSQWIISHSPKWLPLKGQAIENLKTRVANKGEWGIFAARMTPFLRGYVSVVAGMLTIKRKAFSLTVIISALLWNTAFVLTGRLLGPYWDTVLRKSGLIQNILLIILLIVILVFAGKYFQRKQLEKEK
jgi:membrane protein DedA with SNARE-associated domain